MKHLQFNKLLDNYKRFGVIQGVKFWIADIKYAHSRCNYCGIYLFPWLLYKNVAIRPQKLCSWQDTVSKQAFVCSHCHYLYKTLYDL